MFGMNKKVERVRRALHEAFVARASVYAKERGNDRMQLVALILVEIADVIMNLKIEDVETEGD